MLTINKFDDREQAISYLRNNIMLKNSIVSTNFMYEGYDVEEYFVEYSEDGDYGVPCESGMVIAYSDMPDRSNWLHLS